MVLAISVFLQLMYKSYFQTEKKKEECCSKTFPSVIHYSTQKWLGVWLMYLMDGL